MPRANDCGISGNVRDLHLSSNINILLSCVSNLVNSFSRFIENVRPTREPFVWLKRRFLVMIYKINTY